MSIKCSLLGHSFGETTVEREREEEGTEVVITITEMETCSRCGESRVVSENKEVTTLEAPDDVDAAEGDEGSEGAADEFAAMPADDGAGPSDDVAASGTAETTDAVILGEDDSGKESSAQAEARGADSAIPDAESDAPVDSDASEDDAVIIGDAESDRDPDEDGEETAPDDDREEEAETEVEADADVDDDRDPGEWPEEPSDPAERAGESDEVEILDDGLDEADTDAAADDADVETPVAETAVDADDDETETVADDEKVGDRSAGAWPDEDESAAEDDAMGEWPEATLKDEPADTGFSGPSLGDKEGHSVTVPEGTFKCSECGFTTEADATSLRAGDFCPECHRGTLLEPEGEAESAEE